MMDLEEKMSAISLLAHVFHGKKSATIILEVWQEVCQNDGLLLPDIQLIKYF